MTRPGSVFNGRDSADVRGFTFSDSFSAPFAEGGRGARSVP